MRQHLLDEGLHLNLKVTRPNQVWSMDITYVPMAHVRMYLVAIIDVFSRRILSWKLSNTLDASESVEVLQLMQYYNTERHRQDIDNEIPEHKYENNKLLILTHKAA